MRLRLLVLAAVAAAALLSTGADCDRKPLPSTPVFVDFPRTVSVRETTEFRLFSTTSDGQAIRYVLDWGRGPAETAAPRPSGDTARLNHAWDSAGLYPVKAMAFVDETPSRASDWSAPETIEIAAERRVIWFWWNNDDDQASLSTSPVLTSDGTADCIWATCEDDGRFYGLSVSDARTQHYGNTWFMEYVFTGHPAFCAQTGHIIVGSDEGELYALNVPDLSIAWSYPGRTNEESLSCYEWGAAAINGNKLYVGHDDDSVFCLTDNGPTVTRVAAYGLHASMVDAPVIDAVGNVCFGTHSGYLYKMPPDLSAPIWRTHLQQNGGIHGPVLDADGSIYCSSDSNRLCAVSPADGSVKWAVVLNGRGTRPVVGADGVYLGTSTGRFCKLDRSTGATIWDNDLGTSGFATSSILAVNGYAYVQNEIDVLYCVRQSDGDTVWVCDCPASLPGGKRARTTQLTDYDPSPTITADGNIIVVGDGAVYLVKGYPEGPLDPSAPWPKWQHDLYNTGNAAGGR
jgi:outer membrane protein assembly factor BamB